ncbi:TetR/AcrR family transcriptional regulator [Nonomuraea dietziae]|jgi:AcrR family transcriptional regulator|uniref:TetR/AcrR family transcriptional regulator n=1 Tax=Nonomuraea dietziae TaxID=65515 RepID=UPI003412C6B8
MDTRERILDAATRAMRDLGVARATTKEIAKAADCSEALLYKHFSSKEMLYNAVFRERIPVLKEASARLHANVGKGSLEENLTEYALAAVRLYKDVLPLAGGMFADPMLLDVMRASFASTGSGPHQAVLALARFLRAEQRRGRVLAQADPDAAAALLLGACFQRAFFEHLVELPDDADRFAADLVSMLAPALIA